MWSACSNGDDGIQQNLLELSVFSDVPNPNLKTQFKQININRLKLNKTLPL